MEHQADRKRRLLGHGACSVLRVVMVEVKKSRNETSSPQSKSKYQDMYKVAHEVIEVVQCVTIALQMSTFIV